MLLDGTAQVVWELVSGRTTGDNIETLAAQYGLPTTEIAAPVRDSSRGCSSWV